ncbi:hypothetical protein BDN70DRAFT_876550 [Pholiota conissans]|uniref:DUF3752 domain-containing protein n=1 Tax=Pholiota conissans TaxID=109636 RepID=A0A9P6D325_9AGAR|nr:hypothetical protein BDN70DRAFT_876550 [Pholiota conissans]
MPIGPEIPPHLLKRSNSGDSDDDDGPQPASIGPQIPTHLLSATSKESKTQVFDDDDFVPRPTAGPSIGPSIGPSMPPHLQKPAPRPRTAEPRPIAGPSMPPPSTTSSSRSSGKRNIGPTMPSYVPTYEPNSGYGDESDSDDDDVGPKPLPAGMVHVEADPVKEFMEREEKRRKLAEEAAKPKTAKRDEWMLVPPTSSSLLGNLDPTKLKARQFSRGTAPTVNSKNDMSLWTETPAERQQRLADEVSGKKRRVTDAPVDEDMDEKARKRRRKEEEEAIRRGVEEHTRKKRGAALVDQHADGTKKAPESDVPGIWDHSRDMGLGGRLMDDDKRNKMLKEAKGLGDRFGSGKGGGFL